MKTSPALPAAAAIAAALSTLAPKGLPATRAQEPAAPVAAASAPVTLARVSLKESLRKETLTTRSVEGTADVTESTSAAKGTLTVEAELPIAGLRAADLPPDTPVEVAAGGFTFRSTLGADPQYRSGRTEARVSLTQPNEGGKSRDLLATGEFRWDKDRLRVKIQGRVNIQRGSSAVAADYVDGLRGDFQGETTVRVRFGALAGEASVPYKGKKGYRSAGGGLSFGEVSTVDLRGEVKAVPR